MAKEAVKTAPTETAEDAEARRVQELEAQWAASEKERREQLLMANAARAEEHASIVTERDMLRDFRRQRKDKLATEVALLGMRKEGDVKPVKNPE
jgi:hypothetical protein